MRFRADQDVADLISAAPQMTGKTGQLFLMLWSARGRFVSYEVLIDKFYEAGDDVTLTPRGLQNIVKHLKPRIPADWPVSIENKYGVGYRLLAPQGWTWENSDAP